MCYVGEVPDMQNIHLKVCNVRDSLKVTTAEHFPQQDVVSEDKKTKTK